MKRKKCMIIIIILTMALFLYGCIDNNESITTTESYIIDYNDNTQKKDNIVDDEREDISFVDEAEIIAQGCGWRLIGDKVEFYMPISYVEENEDGTKLYEEVNEYYDNGSLKSNERNQYDEFGNIENNIVETYDENGVMISYIDNGEYTNIDDDFIIGEFDTYGVTYDENGKAINEFTDYISEYYVYNTNNNNNICRFEIYDFQSDELEEFINIEYDDLGNPVHFGHGYYNGAQEKNFMNLIYNNNLLIEKTDDMITAKSEYTYDDLKRIISKKYIDYDSDYNEIRDTTEWQYAYNESGYVKEVTIKLNDSFSDYVFEYDENGNIISADITIDGVKSVCRIDYLKYEMDLDNFLIFYYREFLNERGTMMRPAFREASLINGGVWKYVEILPYHGFLKREHERILLYTGNYYKDININNLNLSIEDISIR